jgi:hypothetical protein
MKIKKEVNRATSSLHQEEGIYLAKHVNKNKFKIPQGVLLIGFVVIMTIVLFLLTKPFITGYVTSKGTFIDAVNLEFDKLQESAWTPENPGQLTSVRISGELIGEGSAKVYLKTESEILLIYDSEKPKSLASAITGFALEPTEEEQASAEQALSEQSPADKELEKQEKEEDKEEKQEDKKQDEQPAEEPSAEIPTEEPGVEPAPEQPAEELPIETPTEEPSAEPVEEQPAEKPEEEIPAEEKISKFDDICVETCLLNGLNQSEYTLVVEVDEGTKLNIQEIIYTLKKEEILPAINITNETITENLTVEVQYNTIKEDKEIQAVIDSIDYNNETNTLLVIFHHESDNIQPVAVLSDYSLEYSFDKNESFANENVSLAVENWNPEKYFEIKIGGHSQIIGIGEIPEYDVNAEVNDAEGNAQNVMVEFEKPVSQENEDVADGKVKKGEYDIKIKPSEKIKEIVINDVTVNGTIDNLIDIDTNVSIEGKVNAYAIDPTIMEEFTSANVTATAVGTELWKCKDWNFTEKNCFGEWIKVMDIVPGQDYTFELTAEDPGFGEILITAAQHLDENRTFISDVYALVNNQDEVWTEPIYHNQYIKATFESNLTNGNVINLVVRNNQSLNTAIKIYENNGSVILGSTPVITTSGQYNIILSGMSGSNDIFDIKVVNAQSNASAFLEFDYIKDAPAQQVELFNVLTTDTDKGNIAKAVRSAIIVYNPNNEPINVTSVSETYTGGVILHQATDMCGVCNRTACTSYTAATDCKSSGTLMNFTGSILPRTIPAKDYVYFEYTLYDNSGSGTANLNTNVTTQLGSVSKINSKYTNTDKYTTLFVQVYNRLNESRAALKDKVSPGESLSLTFNMTQTTALIQGLDTTTSDFFIIFNETWTAPTVTNATGTACVNLSSHTIRCRVTVDNTPSGLSSLLFGPFNTTIPSSASDYYKIITIINGTSNQGLVLNGYNEHLVLVSGVADSPSIVNLVSPANGNVTILNSVNFICNATDDINLKNMTLYWNYSGSWLANGTVDVTGLYNQTTFERTNLNNTAISWNCYACDNASQCSFAPANYTVNVYTFLIWSNNKTSPASGVNYSSGQQYQFNITWTGNALATVLFENNFNGTLVNYSASGNLSTEYFYNYANLAAGTYLWKSCANNTAGSLNCSSQFTYVVNKANQSITSLLNGNSVNLAVTYPQQVNASYTGTNQTAVSITINGTSVNIGQNYTFAAGGYIVNYSMPANQNYSLFETYLNLTINATSAQTSLIFDKASPQNYSTAITPTCSALVGTGTPTLLMNGNSVTSGNPLTLAAGNWTFNCSLASSQNYTAASNSSNFTINQITPTLNYYLNGATANLTNTVYGTQINASGTNTGGTLDIYRNGAAITNGANYTLGVSYYRFDYNVTGNQNYTDLSRTLFANVTQALSQVNLTLNGTKSNITIEQFNSINLSCSRISGEGNVNLYKNGTLINSGVSISNLTAFNTEGLYNITCIYPESQNYSSSFETYYVNATSYTDLVYPTWSNNKTNANSSTKQGDNVYFNITLNDNAAGGDYIFSYDNGSGFANDSAVAWNNQEVSVLKTITAIRGNVVRWFWWFNDSAGNENQTDIWSFTVANTVPSISNVDIKPDNPMTTDNLYCNYTYSDADGDAESGTAYKWFKDNILQGSLTTQTISNTYTNDNEVWMCEVTPNDGFNYGNAVNSTTETIGGSNPSIVTYSADSNSTNPKNVGENITFTLDWSDPDQPGEAVRVYVCNSSSINSSGCAGKTFCSTSNSAADPAECNYTALQSDNTTVDYWIIVCDDSNLCSGVSSGTFDINHAPVMLTASILPATAYTNDLLTCSGTYSDSDSDSVSIDYLWFRNNALVSGQNSSTFDCSSQTCDKSDTIICQQTAVDMHEFAGNSMNATRAISNSVPAFTGTISDQSWYIDTNKTEAFDLDSYFSDADLDVLSYSSIGTANITVTIDSSGIVNFTNPENWTETEYVTFIANDSEAIAYSNNITLTVITVPAPTPSGGGGGGGCTANWQCTEWTECSTEGLQTRTCTDLKNCGKTVGKPAESQACVPEIIPLPAPVPGVISPETIPEGYANIENEGISISAPKIMNLALFEETSASITIRNNNNRALENVDIKVNTPESDCTPQEIHQYPTIGWQLSTVLGGIGISGNADYNSLSWKVSSTHYDSIGTGEVVTVPLDLSMPAFKDKSQIVRIEILENGKVILSYEMPVELICKQFFVISKEKSDNLRDIFIGYDNTGQEAKKVSIEFNINKGNKVLFIDYFGPYNIEKNGKFLVSQQYSLSSKLAKEEGLMIKLRMTEKGKTIGEAEAPL